MGFGGFTGNITFRIDTAAPVTITAIQTGAAGGSVTPMDLLLYADVSSTVAVGDALQLLAGTLTTISNVSAVPPADAAYQTFVASSDGVQLDAVDGMAGPVPEPSTWALLALGAAGLALAALRRRVCRARR